jgi:hypothetical protein
MQSPESGDADPPTSARLAVPFHPFRGMFVSAICPTMLACASKRGIVGEITSDEYQLAKAQLLHG